MLEQNQQKFLNGGKKNCSNIINDFQAPIQNMIQTIIKVDVTFDSINVKFPSPKDKNFQDILILIIQASHKFSKQQKSTNKKLLFSLNNQVSEN